PKRARITPERGKKAPSPRRGSEVATLRAAGSSAAMNLDRLRQKFFEGLTRYRWLETVGRGGMGIVFKAQDLHLEEAVAIKVLPHVGETDDQQPLQRFTRETNLTRNIKPPTVARIHDFGMSGDSPYIPREYAPGKARGPILQIGGRLARARAV